MPIEEVWVSTVFCVASLIVWIEVACLVVGNAGEDDFTVSTVIVGISVLNDVEWLSFVVEWGIEEVWRLLKGSFVVIIIGDVTSLSGTTVIGVSVVCCTLVGRAVEDVAVSSVTVGFSVMNDVGFVPSVVETVSWGVGEVFGLENE